MSAAKISDGMSERSEFSLSVSRALQILSLFNSERPALGVTEISRVLSLSKSSTLRFLQALEMHGYPIVKPQRAPSDIWHDLSSFEACLRLLAEHKIEGRALRLGR